NRQRAPHMSNKRQNAHRIKKKIRSVLTSSGSSSGKVFGKNLNLLRLLLFFDHAVDWRVVRVDDYQRSWRKIWLNRNAHERHTRSMKIKNLMLCKSSPPQGLSEAGKGIYLFSEAGNGSAAGPSLRGGGNSSPLE